MKKLSILFAALMACTLSFAATFVEKDVANIKSTDVVIITIKNSEGAVYAMSNDKGTSSAPAAVPVTVSVTESDIRITTDADNILWNLTFNAEDQTFTIKADGTTKYLYCTNTNNGVRVGTGKDSIFSEYTDYLYNVGQKRYLGVYNKQDWRCYGSIHNNIKEQQYAFYVKEATADVPATAIALDQTTLELEQYKHAKLTATLTPVDATTTVTWTSSNEAVATVSSKGVISALTTGTTTITATAGELTATCAITVKEATAITCAQAVEIAKTVSANNEVAAGGKYVIRGYVTALQGTPATDFETYGNYSVWMADTKDGGKVFEAYQVAPTDGKTIAAVGDYVEVIGDITKYNTTYETVGKTGTITVIAEPVEPTTPTYCQTEVGHFLAENADPNSYILLSIGSKDGKTIVRIDQDTEKNTQMFDYLQVTGLVTAGADVAEGGEKAMAVEFDTPAADAEGNITLEILWSTIGWEGRWMIQNLKVSATAECEHAVLVGPGSAINNATIESNIVKRIENGILIIEKDGVRYNAQGVKLN